jgi:glycosyltransferase involved in cell wall biosynthesis
VQRQQNQKTLAVFYPAFLGGGAEAVALWMLQALTSHYQVTLFTVSGVDLRQLDALYGTTLTTQALTVRTLFPYPLSQGVNTLISNVAQVRSLLFHWLIYRLKQESDRYDGVISAYNAVDLGKPGLQYIHWVRVLEGVAWAERISRFDHSRMTQNLSIANSATVAEVAHQTYGVNSVVVYPPVVLPVQTRPWGERELAFVCSGRLTEAKQPHKVVQILAQVREAGFPIHLHLTGGGGGIYGWRYERFLRQFIQPYRAWVMLHDSLTYRQYAELLSRCQYGLHYKKEPFGIAIAEMVKAGLIPFVRRQGGQVEIVGADQHDLFFSTDVEAVEQIIALLRNPERQQQVRDRLSARQSIFSTERFMAEIYQQVQAYLAEPSHSLKPIKMPHLPG